jgi:hypothetical protein
MQRSKLFYAPPRRFAAAWLGDDEIQPGDSWVMEYSTAPW